MGISTTMMATLQIKHAVHVNEQRTARVMMPNLGLSKTAACVTNRATKYNTKLLNYMSNLNVNVIDVHDCGKSFASDRALPDNNTI